MADVFVSYSKQDHDEARLLAAFLEAEGYSVWWDASLVSGESFRKVIMTELGRARAVVVIWTEDSINSDWVLSEAGRAHADRKLIPVKSKGLAYKDIPPPFDNMHIENIQDLEKISAALTALLSKPEVSSGAFSRYSKRLRYELLSWVGLLGGILTLATQIQSAITVARWARQLFESWTAILVYFWKHVLYFLPGVEKADAMILTFMSLVLVNLLACTRKLDEIAAKAQRSRREWIKATIWSLMITGAFVAGNPRLSSPSYIGGFIVSHGEPALGPILSISGFLQRAIFRREQADDVLMWMLWTYLFVLSAVPIVLLYFIVSRIAKVRLSVELLSLRLSRIVVGLGIVVALNYLAVWWDRQMPPLAILTCQPSCMISAQSPFLAYGPFWSEP